MRVCNVGSFNLPHAIIKASNSGQKLNVSSIQDASALLEKAGQNMGQNSALKLP
jgi:hypothetical protein